jgi:hypothetical protein
MKKNIKDFNGLSDIYIRDIVLKENESSSEDIELKEFLKKLTENSEKLVGKIEKLKNLLIQDVFNKQFQQSVYENPEKIKNLKSNDIELNESYINEGKFSQLKSNISGYKRFAYGEKTPTGESNIQSHRVNKRFEILKNKIERHLRELERDLETTSDSDNTVKNEIKQMISRLGSDEFNITPKQSKLGDIRHKLGRGVEWVTKGAVLGAIGAAIGIAVSSIAGVVGVPALMLKTAIAAAVRKTAADVINGKKPEAKQVAMQSAIAAIAAPVLGVTVGYIYDHMNEVQDALGLTVSDNLPTDVSVAAEPEITGTNDISNDPNYGAKTYGPKPTNDISNDPNYGAKTYGPKPTNDIEVGGKTTGIDNALDPQSHFEKYHDGPFDTKSPLDNAKLAFDNEILNRNITGQGDWADGPSPAIINAASDANLNPEQYEKLASELKKLTNDEIKNFTARLKSNPEKYSKALIRVLLKK